MTTETKQEYTTRVRQAAANAVKAAKKRWGSGWGMISVEAQQDVRVTGQREEAMRWIGFIQGALWEEGIFPIEALKWMDR